MCEPLMPDVMVPEAHPNDHSFVCELSEPTFDSLCKSLVDGRCKMYLNSWVIYVYLRYMCI